MTEDNKDPKDNKIDEATQKVLLGLAIFFSGLIGLIVVVAMIQGRLDPTGIVTLLGGILSGVVGGIIMRKKSGDDNPK